ncbi:MAG TPA: TIGR02594 family protein [Chthoniobacteraceae bacterium]|nr:TIGR02594 family protein [Chthoniobacteraceae bacterium]
MPRPGGTGSTDQSAQLYAHALKDDGLRETAGKGSTPRIREAILGAASWLDPDDSATAWCGCIMGLWVKEIGLTPPVAHYRAASWLDIGTEVPLASARPGDIVVISRTGGNHVALYLAHDTGTITLYGGNQSNAVNIAKFPRSSLRGVRRLA